MRNLITHFFKILLGLIDKSGVIILSKIQKGSRLWLSHHTVPSDSGLNGFLIVILFALHSLLSKRWHQMFIRCSFSMSDRSPPI
jgi:hypothetical protein